MISRTNPPPAYTLHGFVFPDLAGAEWVPVPGGKEYMLAGAEWVHLIDLGQASKRSRDQLKYWRAITSPLPGRTWEEEWPTRAGPGTQRSREHQWALAIMPSTARRHEVPVYAFESPEDALEAAPEIMARIATGPEAVAEREADREMRVRMKRRREEKERAGGELRRQGEELARRAQREKAPRGTQLALFNPPRRELQPYTTATGTRSTLDGLAAAGWGMLITPDAYTPGRARFALEHGMPIGIDNGAWSAFQQGLEWGETYAPKFQRLVELLGQSAQWVVAPDIVAGGQASLELSLEWLPWLLERTAVVLVPVQDGMEPHQLSDVIDRGAGRVGIFLGGSTGWKWETAPAWGELAQRWGVPFHLARVNSKRGLRIAATVGATSIDGTGPVQFPSMLGRLERERQQLTMELHADPAPCCGPHTEMWSDPTTGALICVNCGETQLPDYHWRAGDPQFER